MVKKVKSPAGDFQSMLLRIEPEAVARALRTVPREETLSVLLELLETPEAWRDLRVPARIAKLLLHLGEEEALLDEVFDLAPDWHDGDDAELIGLGALVLALGSDGSPSAREAVLDHLDETLALSGAVHPAANIFVEILVDFGERGVRCERAWRWLEQVRAEEPALWASFAGSYGDARAVPLLHALLDPIDPSTLEGLAGDDPVARIVIEVADALGELNAVRPRDAALLERVRTSLRTRATAMG
ncbi:MAG: hypothetical protein IT382_15940 [Deltaproteobacteria bacterium]|nr:hypothetical protein [Deltaproteobacteria bacterium]